MEIRHERGSVEVAFIGQLAASTGFTIYSLLLRNWVFSVTNGVMLLSGLLGWAITVRQKGRARS